MKNNNFFQPYTIYTSKYEKNWIEKYIYFPFFLLFSLNFTFILFKLPDGPSRNGFTCFCIGKEILLSETRKQPPTLEPRDSTQIQIRFFSIIGYLRKT